MTAITDRDPEEMSHQELREEWKETWDRVRPRSSVSDEEREAIWERRAELWDEMESRVDVEYPECPDCDAQRWVQGPGDPKECANCGYVLGGEDMEIVDAVNETWKQVRAGPQEVA